ncbi:MAG: glycosyltransferase [Clostridiales bacterium]|nr:glycosyltransferase [Clostridiales bacterium]
MISAVLLAYREEESLKLLFPRLIPVLDSLNEEYEIIVVDTNKPTDNTAAVCKEYGARYVNQDDPGFGGAYRKGISVIKGDKMLVLDSDGSHDPKFIPDIYNKFIEGYDVVIGSRYTKGGKTEDAVTSRIMSHILNGVFRLVTGVKAKDLSTNFRIYRADVLHEIKLTSVNYDVLEEVLLLMKIKIGKSFKVGEIPITFNKRIAGESKRRLIPFIMSYLKTMFRLIGIRIRG